MVESKKILFHSSAVFKNPEPGIQRGIYFTGKNVTGVNQDNDG